MKKNSKTASAEKYSSVKRVRVELSYPQAQKAFIAGTFNNWQPATTPLKNVGNGRWATDLELSPGRYEYRFVIDGQWISDPQAKDYLPNPYGGFNSVLSVSS